MNLKVKAWQMLRTLLFQPVEFEAKFSNQPIEVWVQVINFSNRYLVGSALWAPIKTHRIDQSMPDDIAQYLQALHKTNLERNRNILAECVRVASLLNKQGIEPLVFKGGGFLIEGRFDDLGARYLGDLDFLVPADQLLVARSELLKEGYQAVKEHIDPNHRHLPPLVNMSTQTCVELHRSMIPLELNPAFDVATQFRLSRSISVASSTLRVQTATAAALTAVLHSEVVNRNLNRFVMPLRSLLDIHQLQHSALPNPDWAEVQRRWRAPLVPGSFRQFTSAYKKLAQEPLFTEANLTIAGVTLFHLAELALVSEDRLGWFAGWNRLWPDPIQRLTLSRAQRRSCARRKFAAMLRRKFSRHILRQTP